MEQVPSGIPDQVRAYLFRQLNKLELLCQAIITKPTTKPAILSANWSNYGGVYSTVQYYKTNEGIVHVLGLCLKTGVTTALETVFTLPTGYRPAGREIFNCIYGGGQSRIDVDTNGTVVYITAGHTVGWLSFSGISFLAAQ